MRPALHEFAQHGSAASSLWIAKQVTSGATHVAMARCMVLMMSPRIAEITQRLLTPGLRSTARGDPFRQTQPFELRRPSDNSRRNSRVRPAEAGRRSAMPPP